MRRASSSGPIIVKLPAASKRRRISVSEKEVESRPSKGLYFLLLELKFVTNFLLLHSA
jgi:hypothetical protein